MDRHSNSSDMAPSAIFNRVDPAPDAAAPPPDRRRPLGPQHAARRRRRTMQRLLLIGGFAALYLLALVVFREQGLLAEPDLIAAGVLVGSSIAVFFTLFISGLNRKAAEKSLSAPMALCGLAIMLWVVYRAPATHIVFAPFVFVTIAFGTYRLTARVALLLALTALAGFGAIIQAHSVAGNVAPLLLQFEWLQLLVTGLALPGFLLLSVRVRRMDDALFRAGVKIIHIKENARRDPMLGCYNRRYTLATLEQQKRLADEMGTDLCLALLDIDHFKRVNDEIGHLGGDHVLINFARTAEKSVRRGDVFGRYGGEEFLLILPDTDLLTALNVSERIRTQVEHHPWGSQLPRGVTASIGLTQYIPGESVLDLFSRTDTAMYLAKQGGRNQVVVEEPPLP